VVVSWAKETPAINQFIRRNNPGSTIELLSTVENQRNFDQTKIRLC
jgi:hypothetical protein